MKNKCINPLEFWVMCTLVPKPKNNKYPDILNFFEHMLFQLTIDRKDNKNIDFHIQKNSGVDCIFSNC